MAVQILVYEMCLDLNFTTLKNLTGKTLSNLEIPFFGPPRYTFVVLAATHSTQTVRANSLSPHHSPEARYRLRVGKLNCTLPSLAIFQNMLME